MVWGTMLRETTCAAGGIKLAVLCQSSEDKHMGWEETKEASDPSDRFLKVLLMTSDGLLPATVLLF